MAKGGAAMEKMTVNFRASPATIKRLDEIAKLEERNRSFLLNKALEEYLDRTDWQVEEVKKAIAECDAGEFLTDEEFRAEVRSWDR
jgi:RHH-type rel operon transcriptional repressor/antitoxin RelB